MYQTLITNPLLNILIFFYNTIAFSDLGLAIIFLTIFIRIILFPIFQKSARYQVIMQALQPKLKELQEKHKDDKTKQTEAMLALYKEYRVNPFSGILFLIIQLPILIGLYQIFLHALTQNGLVGLYSFISVPTPLHTTLLGLIDLQKSNIILVGLAAALQYIQALLMLRKHAPGETPTQAEKMSRKMAFIGPILTIIIFSRFPAAVSLYWVITSIASIIQQLIVNKELDHGLGIIRQQSSS